MTGMGGVFGQVLGFAAWLGCIVSVFFPTVVESSQGFGEGNRIAVVIGNGAYESSPIPSAVADAELIGQTLRKLGFEVDDRFNLSQKEMKRTLRDFGHRLVRAGKNAVGLVFYSGHGVQVGGENFLIPVDAEIIYEGDVDLEAISALSIIRAMAFAGNEVNLILLDASRENPFRATFRTPVNGLVRMDAPHGTLIAYSASPNSTIEPVGEKNSPFVATLSRFMKEPGMPVEQMLKNVRVSVMGRTHDRQIPWEGSSLTGDFFFSGNPLKDQKAAERTDKMAELEAWNSIRNSKSTKDFRSYLERFPQGTFVILAQNRIKRLKAELTASGQFDPDGKWNVEITEKKRAGCTVWFKKASFEISVSDGVSSGRYFVPRGIIWVRITPKVRSHRMTINYKNSGGNVIYEYAAPLVFSTNEKIIELLRLDAANIGGMASCKSSFVVHMSKL